ncbi:hypothetical protein WA577_005033, partial [Blastocystis sp. JDR]
MVSKDMEYKILMVLTVCLMIMGACEIASFNQWGNPDNPSPHTMAKTANSQRFRKSIPSPDGYGYGGMLESLKKNDFSRFRDSVYVDYTGAGQYLDSQIAKAFEEIKKTPFGNTHSNSPASKNSEIEVDKARKLILEWFHTSSEEYDVVFTSGATASLHLIGETFPWTRNSHFYYLRENHNSVLGIREFALHNGAKFHVINSTDVEDECKAPGAEQSSGDEINNLFAYPLEENFSGKMYPKEWINLIQGKNRFHCSGKWYVLLDIAAFAPTHDLDLSKYSADFVVLSFYKMFGFPTGIGALLIRHASAPILNKMYYGGGSVLQTVTQSGDHRVPTSTTRRFEDGTPNFLGISALKFGFEALAGVGGPAAINKHTMAVTHYLYGKLKSLRHYNGQPVLEIYGNHASGDDAAQGPIVTVNVKTPAGEYVSFAEVEKAAAEARIHLRAGWHCNPGAAYGALGLSEEKIAEQIRNHKCFSSTCVHQTALTVVNGVMAGAVRISLGFMTTFEDCDRVVDFFRSR